LPKRELFALVAVPAVVAVILWAPAWVVLALIVAVAVLAADELLAMARRRGVPCSRVSPLLLLAGLMVASWCYGATGLAGAVIVTLVALPAVQLAGRDAPRGSLAAVSIACFAALFVGVLGASLGWLRLLPSEPTAPRLLLLFAATIWIGDSAAYYLGSRFGRHKMSPRISPNKSIEGLLGGTVATFAAAAALNVVFSLHLPWPHVLAVAAILAVAAPLGDLVESQFKRDAQVKDSSNLIPGHGGLLDRTDSLLYGAPLVLGYLVWVGLVP
jgi:phosphatidate cytidylyltransferase